MSSSPLPIASPAYIERSVWRAHAPRKLNPNGVTETSLRLMNGNSQRIPNIVVTSAPHTHRKRRSLQHSDNRCLDMFCSCTPMNLVFS